MLHGIIVKLQGYFLETNCDIIWVMLRRKKRVCEKSLRSIRDHAYLGIVYVVKKECVKSLSNCDIIWVLLFLCMLKCCKLFCYKSCIEKG